MLIEIVFLFLNIIQDQFCVELLTLNKEIYNYFKRRFQTQKNIFELLKSRQYLQVSFTYSFISNCVEIQQIFIKSVITEVLIWHFRPNILHKIMNNDFSKVCMFTEIFTCSYDIARLEGDYNELFCNIIGYFEYAKIHAAPRHLKKVQSSERQFRINIGYSILRPCVAFESSFDMQTTFRKMPKKCLNKIIGLICERENLRDNFTKRRIDTLVKLGAFKCARHSILPCATQRYLKKCY